MTLQQILDSIGGVVSDNLGWILVALLSIIEVSKIKINPWSALFKWLGNVMFSGIRSEMASMKKEMTKEISGVKTEVEGVKAEVEGVKSEIGAVKSDIGKMKDGSLEDKAKAARDRILNCSDEVYNGVRHSKEFFDNVLLDITFYKAYCKAHPNFQNDMTVMAVERIEEVYRHCLEDHDFL